MHAVHLVHYQSILWRESEQRAKLIGGRRVAHFRKLEELFEFALTQNSKELKTLGNSPLLPPAPQNSGSLVYFYCWKIVKFQGKSSKKISQWVGPPLCLAMSVTPIICPTGCAEVNTPFFRSQTRFINQQNCNWIARLALDYFDRLKLYHHK